LTFRVYGPVTEIKIAAEKKEMINNKKLAANERILFVEDSAEILNFVKASLTQFGYSVRAAQNGNQALEMVNKKGYKMHVLFMDVIMPDMNGKELSKKVSGLLPDTKVIFISGYTDDYIVHGGELENDVNFIQKPFTVNTLLSKIREVLDNS